MPILTTRFAPAEKVPVEKILEQFEAVRHIQYIQEIFDALPYIGAILNQERQIVYSNQTLLDLLGLSLQQVLGQRAGEALACVHSHEMPGGCGTSESCSVCGAVRVILEAQRTNQKVTGECRISSHLHEKPTFFDLKVTVTPVRIKNESFFILSLSDISDEKRRRALEKIFFHDVLNMAGSLSGFFSLLKETNDQSEFEELLELARQVSSQLTEEVVAQRELLAAENGDLIFHEDTCTDSEIIHEVIAGIKLHEVAKGKEIIGDQGNKSFTFKTDPIILRRVLNNMLKNALEAVRAGDKVSILSEKKGERVKFKIRNPGIIPAGIQMQIFQRSFSSKGTNRGIGTYSMKLLTENYLKGKIGFTSDEIMGTEFYIEIPAE